MITKLEEWNYEYRFKSFKKWPHKRSNLSPEKMATIGFIHNPTKEYTDNVICVLCSKELADWEENDDPSIEHRNHSQHCNFQLLENESLWTVQHFMNVVSEQKLNILKSSFNDVIKKFDTESDKYRLKFLKIPFQRGKLVYHYYKKPRSTPKCGDCKEKLRGIKASRPMERKNMHKRDLKVFRSYGGSVCHKCLKKRIVHSFLVYEERLVNKKQKMLK
ncbi:60S ribosomal protein L34 [Intoshia linei]|uniref:Large ribosomal subunit protein eL34 n=1 Tax=Intoshia linei TaxID=1819745 RepID=A0A177B2H3_9BILA|nr:60S ribosomal protein L34 [Intoshia linei]